MTDAEFADWRGRVRDTHRATATLEKSVDAPTGEIKIERQEMVGDGQASPVPRYIETESGINITLSWQGDALEVRWTAVETDPKAELIEIPIGKHFQSPGSPSTPPAN